MPLRRYLTGDFAAGTHQRAQARPSLTLLDARRVAADLQKQVTQRAGRLASFRDEGEPVLCEMLGYDAWHALRAFAADQQYPAAGFVFGPDSHRHPALARIWVGAKTRYPHLIRHHDNCGFYLPCDFPEPIGLASESGAKDILVGSSQGLLRELTMLAAPLGMRLDQGEPGWTDQFHRNDPLEAPKIGFAFMRWVVRMSIQSRMPVIFEGN